MASESVHRADEPKSSVLVDATLAAALNLIPGGGSVVAVLDVVSAKRTQDSIDVLTGMLSDLQPERLEERLANDLAARSLFLTGFDYAVRSGLEAKRRLLVQAVRKALDDVAVIDEAWVIVTVLGELDVPHVQLLTRLQALVDESPISWRTSLEETRDLNERLRYALEAASGPVLAALVRTGCAKDVPAALVVTPGYLNQGPTQFGLTLLEELQRAELAS